MSFDPRELLTANLAVVRRAVAFACRRYRFAPADAEDFESVVHVNLIDDDYAILRSFREQSKFSTWISIVVQRMALDYRTSAWGKWRASAEAKRQGDVAVELEQLLHRDGRTLDEALPILSSKYEGVTRESLQALAERLPERAPRRRLVDLDEAVLPSRPAEVDDGILDEDRQRVAQSLSATVAEVLRSLPAQDRLVLQLRFEGEMRVSDIARSLQLDQKLLYRRIEQRLRELRTALVEAGFDPADVVDLIGRNDTSLDFALRNGSARPSKEVDESGSRQTEVSG